MYSRTSIINELNVMYISVLFLLESQHTFLCMENEREMPFYTFKDRLQSFKCYSNSKVLASSLANAGFYFRDGSVQCICCGLRLGANFTQSFDPIAVHRVYSQGLCELANEIETVTDEDHNNSGKTIRQLNF